MKSTIGPKSPASPADLRKCGALIARRELRDARLAAGLRSQEAAAQLLGVSLDTIQRQESGQVRVDAGLLFSLREFAAQQKKTGT